MTPKTTYIILLTSFLFGCSQQTNNNNEVSEQKQADIKPSKKNLLDNIQIPKSWTEITLVNDIWTYSIPCQNERELQTIDLTKVDEQEAVYFYWGTGGQWHAIKNINTKGDSIIFNTLLPFDTTISVLFTFKYLDKDKNIVRWGADGAYCTFIPTQDTGKYSKRQQLCNEDEK